MKVLLKGKTIEIGELYAVPWTLNAYEDEYDIDFRPSKGIKKQFEIKYGEYVVILAAKKYESYLVGYPTEYIFTILTTKGEKGFISVSLSCLPYWQLCNEHQPNKYSFR